MSTNLADRIQQRRMEAGILPGGMPTPPAPPTAAHEPKTVAPDPDAVIIPVSQIETRPQARKTIKNIESLAESIKNHGQLQPVIVTKVADDRYMIAYGERRLRAIRDVLMQDTIIARIKNDIEGATALKLSQISENVHRDSYEPFDLAEEFASLMQDNQWTQNQLAEKVGVSQGLVSKKLSLLSAPAEIQEKIRSGEIAERDWYQSRKAVITGKKKSTEIVEKIPAEKTLTIPRAVAVDLATLLNQIAFKNGLPEIVLSTKPTKTELTEALSRVRDFKNMIHMI